MEERLVAFALGRGGVVTAADALRLGVPAARLSRLRAAGALVRLRRGAYAPTPVWEGSSRVERYALRTRAVLRTRSGVAASHHAALALAGVPVDGLPLHRVDVVDVQGRTDRVRSRRGVVVHPIPAAGGDVQVGAHGDLHLPVAHSLAALARDLAPVDFGVALDQALSCRVTSTEAVRAALRDLCRQPDGRQRARWLRPVSAVVDDADPLSPCAAATRLRIVVTDLGFRPRRRVPLRGRDGSTVVRAELLLGTSVAVARTAYAAADVDRLLAVGVTVAVVPDDDVGRPDRVAAAIATAMRELRSISTGPGGVTRARRGAARGA
jgi:hypothetical protein